MEGWRAKRPNESGRFGVVFGVREADPEMPVTLPCGKCVGCLKDRAEAWSVRCYHESLSHDRNSFVTLTYADPVPDRLNKRHLQLFFKRLRKRYKVRYFACGEYGSRTHRPHYHALIFGEDFRDEAVRFGDYWANDWLSDTWGHGHVTVAKLEPESVFYTCGYSLKNAGHEDCFHLVSRRPYLGKTWLHSYSDDLVRNGFVTVAGKVHPVPAAYLGRKEPELDMDVLRSDRAEMARVRSPDERWMDRERRPGREVNLRAAAAARSGAL